MLHSATVYRYFVWRRYNPEERTTGICCVSWRKGGGAVYGNGKMKKRGRSVLFTNAFYPLALTYWTHRSQIWKVMRSLYKLLERVFAGRWPTPATKQYQTLYTPVTTPCDVFLYRLVIEWNPISHPHSQGLSIQKPAKFLREQYAEDIHVIVVGMLDFFILLSPLWAN